MINNAAAGSAALKLQIAKKISPDYPSNPQTLHTHLCIDLKDKFALSDHLLFRCLLSPVQLLTYVLPQPSH